MKTATNNTEAVIYGMLTENTGGSILDSGGAYGRHWERNQKKTLEDFRAEPEATFTGGDWPEVSKSTFWHLVNHLEADAGLTAAFNKFAEDYPEDSWREVEDKWLTKLGVPEEGGEFYSDARWEFNTYNFDGWLLDQTLQGVFFGMGGNAYLIMQVHGGCDVRGGYTKPQVFELGWEGKEGFIFNAEQADFSCSALECGNSLSIRSYQVEVCDEDGNMLESFTNLEDAKTCTCGSAWK